MDGTRPCILIPGMLGTSLENVYDMRPRTTWSSWEAAEEELFGIDLPSLLLTDDGLADLGDRVVNRPGRLLGFAYGGVVNALRGRLKVPVYVFPYDWRLPTAANARRLVREIRRLRHKPMTSLPGWDGTFDLVCHSLGGMVARAFLGVWAELEKTPAPLGHIVFVACAHQGALDAVEAMVRGQTAFLGGRKELRKLARTFPSVYELLPTYPALVDASGAELDVFDLGSWQESVTAHAARPDPDGFVVNAAHLVAARSFLATLPRPDDPAIGLPADRLLCIVGNRPGSTLRRIATSPAWFDFADAERGDGDEVVLVESARLPGVASVEITWADVSYFEPKARFVSMHAFLMTLDEVQTVTGRFLQGERGAALLPRGMPATRVLAG